MLREQARLFSKISIILDFSIATLSLCLAHWIRSQWGSLHPLYYYIWIIIPLLPVFYYQFSRYGLYKSLRLRPIPDILFALAKTHLAGAIVIATIIYLTKQEGLSRGLFGIFFICSFSLLALEKIIIKLSLGFIRHKGFNIRYIVIVGIGEKSHKFTRYVEQHGEWGLSIVGFIAGSDETRPDSFRSYPVLGAIEDLVSICKEKTIDEVVFCLPRADAILVEDLLEELEEMGVTVRMTLDFFNMKRSIQEVSLFHGEIPIMTFHNRVFDSEKLFIKRLIDIAGALVGLILTLLLLPFIALAIRLESPGPIFFGQQRVGTSGRIFCCWKFRSMYRDAEQRKNELMASNEVRGAMFKISNDPRVTSVGRYLRKTSLDELPQFWNVLLGEMSLVGTRPPTPEEVLKYENWHRRRICIKPGVTGLWQVSGRNQIKEFDDIVKLDLEYIDNWSIMLDLKIILRTVKVVFLREGAM